MILFFCCDSFSPSRHFVQILIDTVTARFPEVSCKKAFQQSGHVQGRLSAPVRPPLKILQQRGAGRLGVVFFPSKRCSSKRGNRSIVASAPSPAGFAGSRMTAAHDGSIIPIEETFFFHIIVVVLQITIFFI